MTGGEGPETRNLAEYLEISAARCPGNAAVVDIDDRVVTYSELDWAAERVAAFLADRGVRPGDRVGVLLPKSAEAVMAIFGALKARATYVPIDGQVPAGRLRAILTDCRIRTVFAPTRLGPVLQECAPFLENVILDGPADGQSAAVRWSEAVDHRLSCHLACRPGQKRSRRHILYFGVDRRAQSRNGESWESADLRGLVLFPVAAHGSRPLQQSYALPLRIFDPGFLRAAEAGGVASPD